MKQIQEKAIFGYKSIKSENNFIRQSEENLIQDVTSVRSCER